MDSLSTYIDHLILLLAARFQAPLEMSTEEVLSRAQAITHHDPWELVSRTVQQTLCTPQTAQERYAMRQLDSHHFTASVCRERARYVQWKLSEERQRRPRTQRRGPSTVKAAAAATTATVAASAADGAPASSFDITRDSLHNDVASLYALVRQSLPSTTVEDGSASDSDGEEPASLTMARAAAPSSVLQQVHEVAVRTPAERQRDEAVARARDEFLSQIQALQTVYYSKYRRWMEVPENVLEPPAASLPSSAVNGNGSADKSAALSRQEEEVERARLLREALSDAPVRTTKLATAAAAPAVQRGLHPTIAAMRRQVHLQRPLRPSAVADDDTLEKLHRAQHAGAASDKAVAREEARRKSAASSAAALTPATGTNSAEKAAGLPRPATAAVTASAAAVHKETAPPVSRRGRWQIVEYGDDEVDVDTD